MPDRWVIDAEFPQGHLVRMTPEEQAQYDRDQAEAAAAAAAAAVSEANAAAIIGNLTSRMTQIRTARSALLGGTIFPSLSQAEKNVLDGLLVDDLYLTRAVLRLYDAVS